jgi:hypothetical protein
MIKKILNCKCNFNGLVRCFPELLHSNNSNDPATTTAKMTTRIVLFVVFVIQLIIDYANLLTISKNIELVRFLSLTRYLSRFLQ